MIINSLNENLSHIEMVRVKFVEVVKQDGVTCLSIYQFNLPVERGS